MIDKGVTSRTTKRTKTVTLRRRVTNQDVRYYWLEFVAESDPRDSAESTDEDNLVGPELPDSADARETEG